MRELNIGDKVKIKKLSKKELSTIQDFKTWEFEDYIHFNRKYFNLTGIITDIKPFKDPDKETYLEYQVQVKGLNIENFYISELQLIGSLKQKLNLLKDLK